MEQQPHEQQGGEHHTAPNETAPESAPQPEPRIYVASLSDYNAGRLHGTWLNAAVDVDELAAGVQTMLATSPAAGAEEWAVHDYEGFGPIHLGEYEDLATISQLAQGITEHGPAFAHWAALIDTTEPDALVGFDDAYLGHYESIEAYAEELLDDLDYPDLIERAIPEHLQPYVHLDVEGFARDLELSGDVTTSEGDGGVYLYDPNR
jgi:antirestriction protein